MPQECPARRVRRHRFGGLGGSAKALFLAALWGSFKRPLIFVTTSESSAESLANDVAYFHAELNDRSRDLVSNLPAWETDPYAGLSPHADVGRARATALWRLRAERADIVVVPARSLGIRLAPPTEFDASILHVRVDDEISQELMLEHLTAAGYVREEPVSSVGEYSRRGGIVDVFSPLLPLPVRIEFFGDSVDSIREFDVDDQRSRNPLRYVDVLPMQDNVVPRETFRKWAGEARRLWQEDAYQDDLRERLVFADDGEPFAGWVFLLPGRFPARIGTARLPKRGRLRHRRTGARDRGLPRVFPDSHRKAQAGSGRWWIGASARAPLSHPGRSSTGLWPGTRRWHWSNWPPMRRPTW